MRTTESIPVGSRWVHKGGAHVTVTSADPFEVRVASGLLGEQGRWVRESFLQDHVRRDQECSAHGVKVICGRWGGVGEEWTVAVGGRYKHYDGRVGTITCLSPYVVALMPDGVEYKYVHGIFFEVFRPAPPESRWLDPASVPVGAPMRVCSKDCPFPSRSPSGPGALCAYCASKDYLVTPRVPPSALSPARRWRSLTGTRWSCGRPERTASASLISFMRKHGAPAPAWVGRPLRASRVRKVRDPHLTPPPKCLDLSAFRTCAEWVLA